MSSIYVVTSFGCNRTALMICGHPKTEIFTDQAAAYKQYLAVRPRVIYFDFDDNRAAIFKNEEDNMGILHPVAPDSIRGNEDSGNYCQSS